MFAFPNFRIPHKTSSGRFNYRFHRIIIFTTNLNSFMPNWIKKKLLTLTLLIREENNDHVYFRVLCNLIYWYAILYPELMVKFKRNRTPTWNCKTGHRWPCKCDNSLHISTWCYFAIHILQRDTFNLPGNRWTFKSHRVALTMSTITPYATFKHLLDRWWSTLGNSLSI